MADASLAQKIDMRWGLENTWSYYEPAQGRAEDEDAATHSPKSTTARYRTFAFAEGKAEVLEPFLTCLNEFMRLWDQYRRSAPAPSAGTTGLRARSVSIVCCEAEVHRSVEEDAPACISISADTAERFVPNREVTTLKFSSTGRLRGGAW
jgi:hypothetical protein